jgi:hypothetical protein
MKNYLEQVINIVKKQAEAFLLDARGFYPFGTCINKTGDIVPVGAYWGNDNPSALQVIEFLESAFKTGLNNGDYRLAAIVVDVAVTEDDKIFDAVEIRFFELEKDPYKMRMKYKIKEESVDFSNIEECE